MLQIVNLPKTDPLVSSPIKKRSRPRMRGALGDVQRVHLPRKGVCLPLSIHVAWFVLLHHSGQPAAAIFFFFVGVMVLAFGVLQMSKVRRNVLRSFKQLDHAHA